uniref:Protein Lines homolog 1-like n=1 Tax=Podarcis muralis TaxID=64176 RepID=A0A670JAB5_PODMU
MTENTKFSHNWASLQQMYDGMLADALFLKDSHSCAALLNPPISLQYLSSTNRKSWAMSLFSPNTGARKSSDPAFTALKTDDEPDTSESVIRSTCHSREIMLLQLTLIKMMLSKMQSQGVAVESKQKYLEIIRILLKEANIDSKLIHLLLISDKQLSYQASKALVFLVRFQLTEEGSLNSPWFAFCSEALSGFPKSSHVAECLWTLTNVIREILKDEGLCKGVHLESIMHPLLAFLKSHVGSSHASEHPCAWLSTLFIEQDDDMLEAAKTLLTVHLKFERMAHIIKFVNSWFWWENIWMPANCSWSDYEDRNGYIFPKPHQLLVTIPYAFGMLALRFFVERCIAAPLANLMGIKSVKRVRPQKNPTLETFFRKCTKKPSQLEIRGLAKKCNWTVHLVEKWFRRRRNLEIPTLHKKFQEACWRFIFYLTSCIAGIVFLYDKPWLYDLWQVWANYPYHSLLASQYWYYVLQMSFYSSLLLTLGFDTKRKDFKAHVIHHFAALALMFCSWCSNHVRIGTLVMLIHDSADFWLEAAKMFNYARWEKTCSFFFIVFSIAFFITRMIFFPFWILRSTLIYPIYYTQTFVLAYIVYNVPLLILQGLHLYWGYLVFKILKKFIFIKVLPISHIPAWAKIGDDKHVKDERSDEEEEDSFSDVEEECTKNGSKNGLSYPLLNNNNH